MIAHWLYRRCMCITIFTMLAPAVYCQTLNKNASSKKSEQDKVLGKKEKEFIFLLQGEKLSFASVLSPFDSTKYAPLIEFIRLLNDSTVELCKGIIGFHSGDGFEDVCIISIHQNNKAEIRKALVKCRTGDAIFLKEIFYRKSGTTTLIGPFNTSVIV